MKKPVLLTRLLCLLVALALLCGCGSSPVSPTPGDPSPTAPTAVIETLAPPATDAEGTFVRELVEPVSFDAIEYQRPDSKVLIDQLIYVTALISDPDTSEDEIFDQLAIFDGMFDVFQTMYSFAYIQHCLNLSDTFYEEEYTYLENQEPLIQAEYERAAIAAVSSPLRARLEDYFGPEQLTFYETHRVYTNEVFVELVQKENELEARYTSAQNTMTIPYQGQERVFSELVEEYADDLFTLYYEIYPQYFEKYNALLGQIYVDLVITRQQMAKAAGFSSYPEFAFSFFYERDYTPDQARRYCASIRSELVPLYNTLIYSDTGYTDSQQPLSMDEAAQIVLGCLEKINPDYAEYFRFMQDNGLWNAESSPAKMPGSFQTYLPAYHEPFIYISPVGTEDDYLTLSHEFGHFTDSMHNDGENNCIDQCEIFSQGMELLTLFYNGLTEKENARLTRSKLNDLLATFVYQGLYADFEDRVYRLSDPTLESINNTYCEVLYDYGQNASDEMDWYNYLSWIDILHFFVEPCYVISYVTSADAALQIFELEDTESGAGVDAYAFLLDNVTEYGFRELLEQAHMDSPFDEDRTAQIAETMQRYLMGS